MSKSRSFSIYLLKPGQSASTALKDSHTLKSTVIANALPAEAELFVLDGQSYEPWWKGYFDIQIPLFQSSKGALIFLPVAERCFALSFGHVYHNLKDIAYEYDFGLRVTLNSIDPQKLKSTDILEPGAARRQRTQMPVDSDLTYFDFDRDSTILKSLTGKVKDKYKHLFGHATGASNLHISSAVKPDGLVDLCKSLLNLYASDDYKTTFPEIQNIAPVRDPIVVESLNAKLIEAIKEKNGDLYLCIPTIITYKDGVCATFSGAGASLIYDDVFIKKYYDYLRDKGFDVNAISVENLKHHELNLTDESGNVRENFPILKCLIFDTTLNDGAHTYHLMEGNWYKIEDDYVTKIQEYLDPFCADLALPPCTFGREDQYNEAIANNDPSYVCLDKTNISPDGETQIEPCDIYAVSNGHSIFHHIKISTLSAQLSHLFNQGTNAIELLKLDATSVEKLKNLIKDRVGVENQNDFLLPLDEKKFKIIFGIVTHKDKTHKSKNLPLFSRISLMRTMKVLQLWSVQGHFGFIDDQSPSNPGKPKPRKRGAT